MKTHSVPYETDRLYRARWSRTLAERETARRARRLAEGLGVLWDEPEDPERSRTRALHDVIDHDVGF